MPDDCVVEAGVHRRAGPDRFREPGVELGDVVGGAFGDTGRHPTVAVRHGHLGQRHALAACAHDLQLLPLGGGAFGCLQNQVALGAVDFAQELMPAGHAAAHLDRDDGAAGDDAADDQLVRHVLGDHFPGPLQRDRVTLADGEGGEFAEFSQYETEGVQVVPAGDGHQVGAIGKFGLVGSVDGGAPVAGVDEQGGR